MSDTTDNIDIGEEWDLIIRPHAGWFNLHLQDLWRYRDLVMLFVRRDFVAQFKQTILGPAWFMIQPLITTIMFTIIFGNIAQLGTDDLPKILFYLSGNILWMYFSTCLTTTSNTFAGNAHLFGKVYFPRLAVPVSIVISQLLKFGLQFLFFIGFLVFYMFFTDATVNLTVYAFFLPVLLLLMAGQALGLGIIFSSMTTKYRDLRFLLDFGIRLAMYATPVIFPLSRIPEKWKWLILINPFTAIIETFRLGFLGRGSFSWGLLTYSAAFTIVVFLVGTIIFNRVEKTFMDTV